MNTSTLERDVELVSELVKNNMKDGGRTMIGVAGPPASGKSTLAESVVQNLNKDNATQPPVAALLPMDGYHLDNRLLESRGLLARKGAPETFNKHGFCEAVQRLATTRRESFHPKFDRHMDLAIANAIVIHPDTPVVIVEGNYVLLQSEPWAMLEQIFSATVFVCPAMEDLGDRLQKRWIRHGLDPEAAFLRTRDNDLPNAELVMRDSRKPDLFLSQNHKDFGVRHAF